MIWYPRYVPLNSELFYSPGILEITVTESCLLCAYFRTGQVHALWTDLITRSSYLISYLKSERSLNDQEALCSLLQHVMLDRIVGLFWLTRYTWDYGHRLVPTLRILADWSSPQIVVEKHISSTWLVLHSWVSYLKNEHSLNDWEALCTLPHQQLVKSPPPPPPSTNQIIFILVRTVSGSFLCCCDKT